MLCLTHFLKNINCNFKCRKFNTHLITFQIVTCSDDACHKIWRVGLEDEEDNKEVIIRGQAEIVERYSLSCLDKMKIETTPSSRHSHTCQETTPNSDEHKEPILTLGKSKTLLLQSLYK